MKEASPYLLLLYPDKGAQLNQILPEQILFPLASQEVLLSVSEAQEWVLT